MKAEIIPPETTEAKMDNTDHENFESKAKSDEAQQTAPSTKIGLPDEVVRRLRERVGITYEIWFGEVAVIGIDNKNGILTLSATSPFMRDWLQSRYAFHVLDAWNAGRRVVGGPRMTRVDFRIVARPGRS